MSWVDCKLGELFEIKHGFAFKGKFFSDEGEKILLTPGNFFEDGGLKLKGDKEKYYLGEFPEDYLLDKGDMLVAMTDLTQNAPILGSPLVIPESGIYLHNQRLGKVINLDKKRVNKVFLYYLLNTRSVREQIKGSATGATVRHTAPSRIYDVEIKLPSLKIQEEIASRLSAYDELIENNNRRIQILETIAQKLYQEWFVHYRFPNHQQAQWQETEQGKIPAGWEVKKLGEIAKVNPESITKKNAPDEIKYIDISSINTGSIEELKPMSFAEAPSRARRIVRHNDIIWATVRPNRKQYSYIAKPAENTIASTGFAVLRAETVPASFLYCATTTDNFTAYLVNHATGAAYPAVNASVFESADVLVPNQTLLMRFDKLVCSTLAQAEVLKRKSKNLKKQRDILVQKLIAI